MGGSSSPQNAGSGLSSLFANNQSTQTGQSASLPSITAPQSLIGQMDFSSIPQTPAQPQPSPTPAYTAPARDPRFANAPSNFHADPNNPGYGWMSVATGDNSEGGQNMYQSHYVSAPVQQSQPAPVPYQPSRSAQIAALINSQFGKK